MEIFASHFFFFENSLFSSKAHFSKGSFGCFVLFFDSLVVLVLCTFWILIFRQMDSWQRFLPTLWASSSPVGCFFSGVKSFQFYEVPLARLVTFKVHRGSTDMQGSSPNYSTWKAVTIPLDVLSRVELSSWSIRESREDWASSVCKCLGVLWGDPGFLQVELLICLLAPLISLTLFHVNERAFTQAAEQSHAGQQAAKVLGKGT